MFFELALEEDIHASSDDVISEPESTEKIDDVDRIITHKQIGSFNQLNAHLLC